MNRLVEDNVGDYDLGDFAFREDTVPLPSAPPYERGAKVGRIGLDTQALGRNNPFSSGNRPAAL